MKRKAKKLSPPPHTNSNDNTQRKSLSWCLTISVAAFGFLAHTYTM